MDEVHPIETLWDEIREKGFRNEILPTLETVYTRS